MVSGGGDQRRESKGGWWVGGPILHGEGSPQETFSPAPPPALGSETVASLAGPAALSLKKKGGGVVGHRTSSSSMRASRPQIL